MLFLGLHAKVKLFIEKDSQRALRDIEESKRQFKTSLEALECQKRKEKQMFSKAINTLKRLYQSQSSAMSTDHSKFIEKLEVQIGMLAEIKESYDGKIGQLKQMCEASDQEQVKQQVACLDELTKTLKHEVQVLRDNQAWLKKDNKFKTDQLNIYLKNCGSQNEQIYQLRKDLIAKEADITQKNEMINQLNELVSQTKMKGEQSAWHLAEVREQLSYMSTERDVSSTVQAAFVKERVNEKLSELHQKLQVENSQLRVDLDDAKTRLAIAESKSATL